MSCREKNQRHDHEHGPTCGHTSIRHNNQSGYLHDGQLHVRHGDHFDDSKITVSDLNPDRCTPQHTCEGHGAGHQHNAQCGHPQVPHGDHTDYLVGNHLHRSHQGHCDDHGQIKVEGQGRAA